MFIFDCDFSFLIYQSFVGGFIITDYLQIIIDLSLGFMILTWSDQQKTKLLKEH